MENLYEKHILNLPCPNCKNDHSLVLQGKLLFCKNKVCDFKEWQRCPICGVSLNKEDYHSGNYGSYFICSSCKNNIGIKKIKYLIENGLYVDKTQRCAICNGPSIPYDKDNAILYKCFFFPKCAGEVEIPKKEKESLVFLDFETTGFLVAKNSIIEIGAIKIGESEKESYFQTFIKPRNKLRKEIINLTGISNEMVEDAPTLKGGISNLVAFTGNSKIVAHSIYFEACWLLTACIRHNIEIHGNPAVCTLHWAKKHNEESCSLKSLTKKYGIEHQNAHRALDDAKAMKDLYFIYKNMNQVERPLRNIEEYREVSLQLVEKHKKHFQP